MKINIKKQSGQKKYPHNLSHDVSTTSDFGFVQPILGREITGDDNVNLKVGCITRLAPMVKPTFGRVTVRQYNCYVPYEDVYHPFGSLLAGKSYRGSGPSYIPTTVPNLSERYFRLMVALFGTVSIYKGLNLDSNNRVNGTFDDLIEVLPSEELFDTVLDGYLEHFTLPNSMTMKNYYNVMATYGYVRKNTFRQDGVQKVELKGNDLADTWVYNGIGYLITFKLSRRGRNLRKVHLGIGNQLSSANKAFSLLPMFCYFKAWFDLFQPARDKTWKDTLLHGMIETLEQENISVETYISQDNDSLANWIAILAGIADCYYTQNPDYISAHVVGQSVGQSLGDVSYPYLDANGEIVSNASADSISESPNLFVNPANPVTQNALDILRSLTTLRNISTAVGGRIKEFLQSIYGSEYRDEKESFFLGSHVFDVKIDDVMSTAETSEGYLGEYAGKGIGGNVGKNLKFKSPAVGCLFSLVCVVPDAQYCQGVDPLNYHLLKDDFFNSLLDAKTLLPTPKTVVFGSHDIYNLEGGSVYGRDWTTHSFGNIPNYSEYCQAKNVLNGDMSLMSTRESYLPFNIDKLLPFDTIDSDVTVDENEVNHYSGELQTSTVPSVCTASSIWRFIGRYKWLGNFDRIFVNSGTEYQYSSDNYEDFFPLDDNFIMHFYVDLKIIGYKLPMSSSFDTGAFGSHMSVEKS